MHLLFLLVIFLPLVRLQWIPVSPGGTPPVARAYHSGVVTSSNTMLVFGGFDPVSGGTLNDIAKYDIATDSWIPVTPGGTAPTKRSEHSAVVTSSNTMLIFGTPLIAADHLAKYDIATDSWIPVTPGGSPPTARYSHSAVVTPSNTMLIFGGYVPQGAMYLNDTAKYDIATDSWIPVTPGGTPPIGRYGHSAVVTSSNTMLIFGGNHQDIFLNDIAKYDLATDSWIPVTPGGIPPEARCYHSAVVTPSNTMLVFGGKGENASPCFNNIAQYDIATDSWIPFSPGGTPPAKRYGHSGILTSYNTMLVFGGFSCYFAGFFNDVTEYLVIPLNSTTSGTNSTTAENTTTSGITSTASTTTTSTSATTAGTGSTSVGSTTTSTTGSTGTSTTSSTVGTTAASTIGSQSSANKLMMISAMVISLLCILATYC